MGDGTWEPCGSQEGVEYEEWEPCGSQEGGEDEEWEPFGLDCNGTSPLQELKEDVRRGMYHTLK